MFQILVFKPNILLLLLYEIVHQAGRCAHGGLIIYIYNELEHSVLSKIDISPTGCIQVRGIQNKTPARLSRI